MADRPFLAEMGRPSKPSEQRDNHSPFWKTIVWNKTAIPSGWDPRGRRSGRISTDGIHLWPASVTHND